MAAEQIMFFERNKADYSDSNVTATASQGSEYASRVLDRSNATAWQTTGSVDADNTTLTIDMVDEHDVTDIILIKHNFKAFTVKYWNGSSYVDFSTPISQTVNTDSTSHYSFTQVQTTKIQVTITGTQTPNDDKHLYQLIVGNLIGQLTGWPVIKAPKHTKNIKKNVMLSGKTDIVQNVGAFSTQLMVKNWNSDADLDIIETLYSSSEGFLVWLCGGNEDQFSTQRLGYKKEDIYLMKCTDDYSPEYVDGLYKTGLNIKMTLTEVVL